ncbi:multiheme c-type cytochrome [Tropicimonas sp. IMCC34043]|uniref:multiheme c-type cytochrome n=1 Tax=Tropicimonas sp. IMCC34043 TaxID=2248760 RepID=UPI000E23FE69|nr:multiheme c-type cytochrome [Tropicimonas sp. IMCC34043]
MNRPSCTLIALWVFAAVGSAAAADVPVPAYVGTDACVACHTAEAEAWTGSHHDLAWTEPTPDNILGDFNDVTFSHRGVTTRFTREGDTSYIESDGPDGKITKWPVAGVIGITPLQQYFVETEPGRYQSFDIPWDTKLDRWYHMYPDQHLPASDAFHWTGPYKTWNNRCAECHSTDFKRNYDPATRAYHSTQSEIGVGCEACHGPGAAHLAWAEAGGTGAGDVVRPEGWDWAVLSPTGLTIDYASGTAETQIQQCAGCHSRRGILEEGSPLPGTPYHDAYRLSTLRNPLYWPDGQIRDEVYVYGSFLQSKMNANGVRCSDCHDVHSGQRYAEGNGICLACHSPAGNPRFPSLRLADYDTPEHHFHEQGSEGAQCVSCHMIKRTYMGIDGRRDHSFRIPRPDLTIATGAPNACTDCHATEGPYWAAAEIEKRFPDPIHRGASFATTFHAAEQGDPRADAGLAEIATTAAQPGIVRATALEMLAASATAETAARMAPLLRDPDPLVRANAAGVQRAAPPKDRAPRLAPLLVDPMRSVRIAAAREMLTVPPADVPADETAALAAAMAEWQTSLSSQLDFPEAQMVLGGIALTDRDLQGALTAFHEAVRLDPQLTQAWSMVVRLQMIAGGAPAARAALAEGLAANPNDPGLLQLQGQLR